MGNSYTTHDRLNNTSASFKPYSFSEGNYRRAYKGRYEMAELDEVVGKSCVVKLAIDGGGSDQQQQRKKSKGGKKVVAKIAVGAGGVMKDLNEVAVGAARDIIKGGRGLGEIMDEVRSGRDWKTSMMLEDVVVSSVASQLSSEFNKRKDGSSDGVKRPLLFNVPRILHVSTKSFWLRASVGDVCVVEDYIEGQYERYVSNNGTLLFHGTLSSFCHFTYHESGGRLLVVDIQGVRGEERYELTDPAIHTSGSGRVFGSLDLGDKGISAFFLTHECTGLCRGLRKPKAALERINSKEKIMMKNGTFDPTAARRPSRLKSGGGGMGEKKGR
ncbi:hypothetical protein TrRE_jg7011 [Triparma retinervis]|uniref:Alpha-type protein kinase domain-containing protein n=1 Tax=Triparma retinervis TaxID=2557542 RepID=A0A9W7E774_9STRA|nr:hypothetical protein TrRE_jg7011 [Triparma retinervis]